VRDSVRRDLGVFRSLTTSRVRRAEEASRSLTRLTPCVTPSVPAFQSSADQAEMTGQELAAVATAAPTPYVHEVVTACQNSGRSVSVVSNNSARAVRSYLARHGLDERISLVVARTSHDPALLKPSPYLITQAVGALNAEPGECTLVGDSVTHVQGARLASVQSIGYANKPGKRERLSEAGAGVIINSLADLALRFRARVADPALPIRSCYNFLY